MMLFLPLAGISWSKTLLAGLMVTLALLVLFIAYKKLLAYLGKGAPVKEHYAVLYGIEANPVRGEVEFYFTLEKPRNVAFWILDRQMNELVLLKEDDFGGGGHIVRFDSATLPNGVYFYGLKSDNQKTIKRMTIEN